MITGLILQWIQALQWEIIVSKAYATTESRLQETIETFLNFRVCSLMFDVCVRVQVIETCETKTGVCFNIYLILIY